MEGERSPPLFREGAISQPESDCFGQPHHGVQDASEERDQEPTSVAVALDANSLSVRRALTDVHLVTNADVSAAADVLVEALRGVSRTTTSEERKESWRKVVQCRSAYMTAARSHLRSLAP